MSSRNTTEHIILEPKPTCQASWWAQPGLTREQFRQAVAQRRFTGKVDFDSPRKGGAKFGRFGERYTDAL